MEQKLKPVFELSSLPVSEAYSCLKVQMISFLEGRKLGVSESAFAFRCVAQLYEDYLSHRLKVLQAKHRRYAEPIEKLLSWDGVPSSSVVSQFAKSPEVTIEERIWFLDAVALNKWYAGSSDDAQTMVLTALKSNFLPRFSLGAQDAPGDALVRALFYASSVVVIDALSVYSPADHKRMGERATRQSLEIWAASMGVLNVPKECKFDFLRVAVWTGRFQYLSDYFNTFDDHYLRDFGRFLKSVHEWLLCDERFSFDYPKVPVACGAGESVRAFLSDLPLDFWGLNPVHRLHDALKSD